MLKSCIQKATSITKGAASKQLDFFNPVRKYKATPNKLTDDLIKTSEQVSTQSEYEEISSEELKKAFMGVESTF